MADEPVMVKTFKENVDVDTRIKEGGILATFYLEVQGNDREAAQKALENTIFDRMKKEPEAVLLEAKMYDLKKEKVGEEEFYSGVAEVKFLATDFRWFVNIVMRYGPAAIEIHQPDEVHLTSDEMHSLVADVSDTSQILTAQLINLLKDDERRAIYHKILAEAKGKK